MILKLYPLSSPYYFLGPGLVRTNISLRCYFHSSSSSFYSIQDLQTLGLTETATKDDIKAAYFKKAKQLHPDSSESGMKGSDEFLKLNEAYKRLLYESKFQGQNHAHMHNQHPNRRYGNPDPRYYTHGDRNPFHDYHYNDHRNPRSYRYRYDHDPWGRPFSRERTEKEKKMDEVQADILRRAFLQLFLGIVLIQFLINALFANLHKDMYLDGCDCEMCVVKRHRLKHAQSQFDSK